MAPISALCPTSSFGTSEGACRAEGLVWGYVSSAQVYSASMATTEPNRDYLTICRVKLQEHGSRVLSALKLVRKELIESELWVRKG